MSETNFTVEGCSLYILIVDSIPYLHRFNLSMYDYDCILANDKVINKVIEEEVNK